MNRPSPTRLLAGEVGKPHGIRGEVYVVPISDDPARFAPGSVLLTEQDEVTVASARRHGNRLLVSFEGIDSRDAAETLRGPLFVPATETRALDEDEYWPHDLVGCELVDATGFARGTITNVTPGPAHDLLVVTTPVGERMVPLVKDIVVDVDIAGRRVAVDPPEGLLD